MMTDSPQKEVVIWLTPEEAQEILAIDLDEDYHQALWFIREKMAKKISESMRRPCAKMAPGGRLKKCRANCQEIKEICCVNGRRRPTNGSGEAP
jgi:hypothetical protein